MKQDILTKLRGFLKKSPIPFSKNHLYDIQTKKIISKMLLQNSNCIDVGCHSGEIMDLFLKQCPNGHHFGFEPIPGYADALVKKYENKPQVTIMATALGENNATTSFTYVKTNPAYSSILERKYDRDNEVTEQIEVSIKRLDDCIPQGTKIDIIKIDVEGAEMLVLKGGKELIARDKPIVIFEHGLGAADVYGFGPHDVWTYFDQVGMKVFTLKNFLKGATPLDVETFSQEFHESKNYYFIAST